MTACGIPTVEPSTILPMMRADPFAILPKEVVIRILSHFDAKELCRGPVRVSKAWKLLAEDDALWKKLYRKRFGELGLRDASRIYGNETRFGRESQTTARTLWTESQPGGWTEGEDESIEMEEETPNSDSDNGQSFLTSASHPCMKTPVSLHTSTVDRVRLYRQSEIWKDAFRRDF